MKLFRRVALGAAVAVAFSVAASQPQQLSGWQAESPAFQGSQHQSDLALRQQARQVMHARLAARGQATAARLATSEARELVDLAQSDDLVSDNNSKLQEGLDRIVALTRSPMKTAPISAKQLKVAFPQALFSTDAAGENYVTVDMTAEPRDIEALKAELTALGAKDVVSYSNSVGAIVPISKVPSFEANPRILFAHPSMPRTRRGAFLTQGDFAIGGYQVRPPAVAGGPTGLGVRVGVMSDSYGCIKANGTTGLNPTNPNDSGGRPWNQNAIQDIASGEFDASRIIAKDLTTAQCNSNSAEDEGRAMMQIVNDIAPDAQLVFYTAFVSETDFANGMGTLINATNKADIVVDDVGYSDEPFFEDGVLSQAAQAVHDAGKMYFSSAGNDGNGAFEAAWHPQTGTFTTVRSQDGNTGPAFNFDLSGATNTNGNEVTLKQFDFVSYNFQWDSPFKTGSKKVGAAGTQNSLNIYLVNKATGAVAARSSTNVTGSNPVKTFSFTQNAAATTTYKLVVELHNGVAPGRIKIVDAGYQDANGQQNVYQFNTAAPDTGTSEGHPQAAGVMGVAAAAWFDALNCYPVANGGPATSQPEFFTSWGGTPTLINYLDDTKFASPVRRNKPDIMAPDGGNTSFFFQIYNVPASSNRVADCLDTDGLANNFFGTSEAAPHAAGLAALMKSAAPYATNDQIYNAMRSSAEDTGTPGFDYQTGYGFLRAPQALAAIVDSAPDAFSFTAVSNANLSTASTSNQITVTGITSPAAISVTGGTYSINGGTATSTAGTVALNDKVSVIQTSSGSDNTLTTATVTIGGVSAGYDVTTGTATPTGLSFTAQTDVPYATLETSNTYTMSGTTIPSPVSIVGGQYSINGGAYTSAAGTISPTDNVTVQVTSASADATAATATLSIGAASAAFTVTTGTQTPTGLAFTAQTGVPYATLETSNTYTMSGTTIPSPVSIVGGQYSINGGAYTSAAGTIGTTDNVTVQVTSASADATATTATLTIGGASAAFTVTTGTLTPTAFSFTAQSDVPYATLETSNSITVSGTTIPSPISIVGGQYSINGGPYTNRIPAHAVRRNGKTVMSAVNTVNPGETVTVQVTSASADATATTATLTIGGVSADFTVTTGTLTPTAFSFPAKTNVPVSTLQTSDGITVAGTTIPSPISIVGGQYSINNGPYTSHRPAHMGVVRGYKTVLMAADTVSSGDTVTVQQTSSGSFSTLTTATLTIGGVSADFKVTTEAQDTTPDAFGLTAVTNAALSTLQTSNTVTVAGINSPAAISISGGKYSVNNGPYTAAAGTVGNTDTVKVQQTSSSQFSTLTRSTLTIGGVSANYDVTTAAKDIAPDPFTFTAITNVPLSSLQTAGPISITGINAVTSISITGGAFSINGGPYQTINTTAHLNDTVMVQTTSSASYGTKTGATLTIGGVHGSFYVTTKLADSIPDPFTFTAVTGAEPGTLETSGTISVSGLDVGYSAAVSITGGSYSKNGLAYTSAAGTAQNGDTFSVQQTASAGYSTKTNAMLTIGGGHGTYAVTTRALDVTPNPISFPAVTGADLLATVTSSTVSISGMDTGATAPITVTGGLVSVNGSAFASSSTVKNGDTVTLQLTSSASAQTRTTATVGIGAVHAIWAVTTKKVS